jgi:hypothetical protein
MIIGKAETPETKNSIVAIVPIKGDPPVVGLIIFIKKEASYRINTVMNFIKTDSIHNIENNL